MLSAAGGRFAHLSGSRDDPARVEFEVGNLSRYLDLLPVQRATQEAYLRRMAVEDLPRHAVPDTDRG